MPKLIPSTPPSEVHDAILVATRVYETLAATGRRLSFRIDDASGRVIVEANGVDGNVLLVVAPTRALEIAGGDGLESLAQRL